MTRYFLPIGLRLPKEHEFKIKSYNEWATIVCKDLEGVSMESLVQDSTKWMYEGEDNLQLELICFDKDKEGIKPLNIFFDDKDKIMPVGYRKIAEHVMINVIVEVSDNIKGNKLMIARRKADSILIRFLQVYRVCFSERNLPIVSIKDSHIVQQFKANKTYHQENSKKYEFEFINTQVQWDDPFRKGLSKKLIANDKVDSFSRALELERRINIYEELLVQAKEQAILYNNYSLSIVLSQSAFETFFQQELIMRCQCTGVKKLPTNKGDREYIEAISSGNIISDLMKKYYPLLHNNYKIIGSREYREWFDNTYLKRNQVIHRGERIENEEVAKRGFMAVQKLMDKIRQVKQQSTCKN